MASSSPTTIKKYANRRLYNTASSAYVTLADLAKMVKGGEDFVVYDAKSNEDITRSVLSQIIFEQEGNRRTVAASRDVSPPAHSLLRRQHAGSSS